MQREARELVQIKDGGRIKRKTKLEVVVKQLGNTGAIFQPLTLIIARSVGILRFFILRVLLQVIASRIFCVNLEMHLKSFDCFKGLIGVRSKL